MLLSWSQIYLLLLILTLATSMDQSCSQDVACPQNSACNLQMKMCSCNQGYIGACNISATPLTNESQTLFLNSSALEYYYINPIQRSRFIEITIRICEIDEISPLTFYFWGESGHESAFNINNTILPPFTRQFQHNCTLIVLSQFYFYTQKNGDSQKLILGLTSNQTLSLQIKVDQKISYAIYVSYYITITIMILLLISFFGSMLVAICRRNRVTEHPGATRDQNEDQSHNLEYFDEYLPKRPMQDVSLEKMVCPICLQNIESIQIVRKTPCQHIFHSSCLDSWCLKNVNCPVCRSDLTYEYVKAIKDSLDIKIINKNSNYMTNWEESIEMQQQFNQIRQEML